jgi:hypothetical protein
MNCSKIWRTCLYKINDNVPMLVFLAGRKNSLFTSEILLEGRRGINGSHSKRRVLHSDFPKYFDPCVTFNVFKNTLFIRCSFLLSVLYL